MQILLYFLYIFIAFLFMEFVAWFTHKYIMHGFLWKLHEDHHVQTPGFYQKNDAFFLIFAVPSALLIIFGSINNFDYRFWLGLGILFYGFAYFLIHEVLIHQRFKKFRKFIFGSQINNSYFKNLQYAHKMHHKHINKEDGESFGMLFIHKKYFRY